MSTHGRRLPVALLVAGFVLPLLTPSTSSAFGLITQRQADAGGLQAAAARHELEPPELAAASVARQPGRPTADGALHLVLLVLALNSAVMLIRMASSPPGWMKD